MTMLYSLYTAEGITFAADSRIMRSPGPRAARLPYQQKVLRVPRLGAAAEGGLIGFFGLAQIGGRRMDQWLQEIINAWPGSHDTGDFADYLIGALSARTRSEQLTASGFHLGAFEQRAGATVPVFCFIRNCFAVDSNGSYSDRRDYYESEEQLIGRDRERVLGNPALTDMQRALRGFQQQRGFPVWYRNGDLLRFAPIADGLKAALEYLVSTKGSLFRAPDDCEGWERLARTIVITTSQINSSYYAQPVETIGERAVVVTVKWP